MSNEPDVALAIFVGGRSRRMGVPKGRLRIRDGTMTILEALVERGRSAGLLPILVGEASPYTDLLHDIPRVEDEPAGAGPLAGLVGALRWARDAGCVHVVAVACDMPDVRSGVLGMLKEHPSTAAILAPRRDEHSPWEPMLARYRPERLIEETRRAIAEGCRSFQQLFSRFDVDLLEPTPAVRQALVDWDTPEDLPV